MLINSKSQAPGPGSYETNVSSMVSTEFTRKMLQMQSRSHHHSNLKVSPSQSIALTSNVMNSGLNTQSSKHLFSNRNIPANLGFGSSSGKLLNPGMSVDVLNSRFTKGGIPTIPSRYLTPILKFDMQQTD